MFTGKFLKNSLTCKPHALVLRALGSPCLCAAPTCCDLEESTKFHPQSGYTRVPPCLHLKWVLDTTICSAHRGNTASSTRLFPQASAPGHQGSVVWDGEII